MDASDTKRGHEHPLAETNSQVNLTLRVPVIKAAEISLGMFACSVTPTSHLAGDELGKGQYGKVYKGKCRGENVAVKVLFKDNSQQWSSAVVEAFEKEVEIMSQIHHPNVGKCSS